MAYRFVLLLPLVNARFDINIGSHQRTDSKGVHVSFNGRAIDIISDKERSSFGLSDQSVKDGAELYFGKRPTDVYFHSPTPENVYETYQWEQVSRTITANEGKLINVATKHEVIAHQAFENLEAVDIIVNVAMSRSVENKVSITWNTGAELTVSDNTKMNLAVKYRSLEMNLHTNLYEDLEKTEAVPFGNGCFLNITLQPGKSIMSELHATKVVARTELDYEARLHGVVAAYYAEKYKEHNYWALDVAAIMEYAELRNSIVAQQNVVSQFYEEPKLIVRDRENGNLIFKGFKCPYYNAAVLV
ncbi:U-megalopygitoxin(8)-Mo12-like [Choristoneura fumiferana]|uniref:U-megalopygitoxin(8)-Mo12-like n=1 Tax=Choristoneura fumiferana TaxID=7141 RepID=UPI003D15AB4B